jgi:CRP-like cAMP-binding protein
MDKFTLLSIALLHELAGQDTALPDDAHAHIHLVNLTREQTLFDIGQPHPHLYVVRQGCLKLLYRREDGREWIHDFVCEGAFFCSLQALMPGGLSSYACVALEACELERIDYRWLENAAQASPVWQQALLNGWKLHATRRELRERDLLTLTPTERYQAFVAQQPGLAKRIPQKDLALFLGITPVSLSRLRARLAAP